MGICLDIWVMTCVCWRHSVIVIAVLYRSQIVEVGVTIVVLMEEENALPHGWENMPYEDFLIERRKLMAAKIKAAFEILKKAAT